MKSKNTEQKLREVQENAWRASAVYNEAKSGLGVHHPLTLRALETLSAANAHVAQEKLNWLRKRTIFIKGKHRDKTAQEMRNLRAIIKTHKMRK